MSAADPASDVANEPTLRFAGAYAFVGSGCLLVLELVAGRILAPAIGVSLYTWTSIIGVVLAGVSIGNYLGGRVADRAPGLRTLSTLYLLGGLASALILALARDPTRIQAPHSFPAFLQVVWLAAAMFLIPSTILAMPTPMLVKLSLSSLRSTGRVVGSVQAWATLGSIVGTFATGFFLISWFGTRAIVAGVAGMLVVMSALVFPRRARRRVSELLIVALFVVSLAALSGNQCDRESNYYCIRVVSGPQPGVRTLVLDLLVHGYVDTRDPTHLLYPYEKLYSELLSALPHGSMRSMFAIGGGTYTFPRFANSRYGMKVLVAEIDPAVTAIAREKLGLSDAPGFTIVHDDARRVLQRMDRTRTFDLIVGDAFNDAAVPFHLTTMQFDQLVAAHLSERGVYMMNVVDAVHHDFLRSIVRTLQTTFASVRVLTAAAWPPAAMRDTYVVVASRVPIADTAAMVPPGAVKTFLSSGRAELLIDDHVPVDQLLAPVFRQRLEGKR